MQVTSKSAMAELNMLADLMGDIAENIGKVLLAWP
jgi:hypothetical protein